MNDGSGHFNQTFSSLNYTLWGYNLNGGTGATFNATASGTTVDTTGTSGLEQLATGTLLGGGGALDTGGIPSALLTVSFLPTAGGAGMFTLIPNDANARLNARFINTAGQITTFGAGTTGCSATGCPNTGFTITNGGGSANFVPEPASLAVLATGLAGIATLRRRRTV